MEDIVEDLRATAGDTDAVENASVARLLENAAAEIERLRQAIRRLADQDATLSVQGGNVTVTMDATLTAEEREAVEYETLVAELQGRPKYAELMRQVLARLS